MDSFFVVYVISLSIIFSVGVLFSIFIVCLDYTIQDKASIPSYIKHFIKLMKKAWVTTLQFVVVISFIVSIIFRLVQ